PGAATYNWSNPSTIAHAMTHARLHDVGLGYGTAGAWPNPFSAPNGSLREGIADMSAIYFRSISSDEDINWISGGDEYCCERDCANPEYDCFIGVEDNSVYNSHVRSDPLRYWFYLCVKGNVALEIPSIDIKRVLAIVLLAATEIEPNSDYEELMNATLDQTIKKYGRCSNEFLALARAWEEICVPTGFLDPITDEIPQCNFSLAGPLWVCEENN